MAGRVVAEVDRLHAGGGVRVLDVLVVTKDPDGAVVESSVGQDEDFGELVSRLFPLRGAADPNGADDPNGATDPDGGGEPTGLWAKAQALSPGDAVVFLLVEHRWARGIADAIDEHGGTVLGAP